MSRSTGRLQSMVAPDDPARLDAVLAVLDEAQRSGLGDMDPETFRAAGHAVVDLMADYLIGVEAYPVLPRTAPGDLRAMFPASAPEGPEPLRRILDDYRRLIEPNVTHWQHPGFMAYFPGTASGPGILGEMLMSTLVANAMLWRTSPIATELEQVTVAWLREALGLPDTTSASWKRSTRPAKSSSRIPAWTAASPFAWPSAASGPSRVMSSAPGPSSSSTAAGWRPKYPMR